MGNMYGWLDASTVEWLLQDTNPTVRMRTLTELLDYDGSDAEVRRTQAQVDHSPVVLETFAAQHEDGHWGDSALDTYRAAGTLGTLGILYAYSVTPDERTRAGCDSFLRHAQHSSGGLSISRARKSGITPCSTGEQLPMLVYFGMADDDRVMDAYSHLVRTMDEADSLVCVRYERQPCLWGAISVLKGLGAIPANLRSRNAADVIDKLCNVLLDAKYDFDAEHKRWLSFSVPRNWDLLSALTALANHGYGADMRFQRLLDIFFECRDDDGRWRCQAVSRTWPLERRNAQSKWVTLDALLLRKMLG